MNDVKNSFAGGLDLDSSYYKVRKDCYVDALNITRNAIEGSQDEVISNIVGNRLFNYSGKPSGLNKFIGGIANILRNTIIACFYNSNSHHYIVEYNLDTRVATRVFESLLDSTSDILQFTISGKITGMNIYNRDEGDLFFFLDSLGRPTYMDITLFKAQTYNPVTRPIIDVCLLPPLSPITGAYSNDLTRVANGFFKKLTRYRYRWVYDDNGKSCYSTISTVPLPINILNPAYTNVTTNNNVINLTLNSGGQNVKDIELDVSISESSNQFARFQRVQIINKSDQGIADDTNFTISFYNDSTYPFIDDNESLLLHDVVPDAAFAQEFPNGNVDSYGNITEGYNKDLVPNVVVTINTIAAGNGGIIGTLNGIETVITDTSTFQIFNIAFSGIPAAGTVIEVKVQRTTDSAIFTAATYTTIIGDTATNVAGAINASFNSMGQVNNSVITGGTSVTVLGNFILQPKRIFFSLTITPPTSATASNSVATWKWSTSRDIALIYYSQQGKTNGVLYNARIDFPAYSENGSQVPLLPFINIKIYHVPPIWAYSYQVVFTKEPTQYLFFETIDVNTTEAAYFYFDITNLSLNQSKSPTTAEVVSWTFQDGDRMRMIRRMSDGFVFGSVFDTAIEGIVSDPKINNVTQTGKTFVKVKRQAPFDVNVYASKFFIIELYRPGVQPPSGDNSVYYECGVQFSILNPTTSIRRHGGGVTDQDTTYVTPAETNIYNGDSYFRSRTVVLSESGEGTFNVQDRNFVDFYVSTVSSIDGRPVTIEQNARQATYGALIRHSEAYQPNTNINGLHRFYPNNFLDCNYAHGNIIRLVCRDKLMKCFQSNKTGRIPLFSQINREPNGNVVEVVTDKLLNPIEYYIGNFGIGTAAASLSSYNFADYFIDNIRGAILRSSYDGIDVISTTYKTNSWAISNLPLRTGDFFAYGGFDQKINNYIIALEQVVSSSAMYVSNSGYIFVHSFFFLLSNTPVPGDIVNVNLTDGNGVNKTYSYTVQAGNTVSNIYSAINSLINADIYFTSVLSPAPVITQVAVGTPNLMVGVVTITYAASNIISESQTLTFSEKEGEGQPSFESFISPKPEGMVTLRTLLCLFKDGDMWTHDSGVYNNFFGVQYDSYYVPVFNDNVSIGKTYEGIEQRGNTIWDCPEIITSVNSYRTTQQRSNLVEAEFTGLEGKYSSSLKRDVNSRGGKINGDFLKGDWVSVKFRKQQASSLITLNITQVHLIESNLNNK